MERVNFCPGPLTVMFEPKIVYCKDCFHRPIVDEFHTIMPPKYDDGYRDYTCPFICEDSYYNRRPANDFYCKFGETHE